MMMLRNVILNLKYDLDTFVIGQLAKNVDPKEIDQEFIVNLKLEVDEMFDQGDDVFKIETTNK
jgi:hypothetical protein